jgi:hypothetical protein
MKSEHRHELKTNELADWLAHAPDWFKENAKTLIITIALIVIVAAIYYWNTYNRNVRVPEERKRLTSLISQLEAGKMGILQSSMNNQAVPNKLNQAIMDLGSFAQTAGNNTMGATAYLQHAKGIRVHLHLNPDELAADERQQQILAAQASYRKAKDLAGTDRNIAAAAEYGLGLCQEELGQYAEAHKTYSGIIANADFDGTAIRTAVQYRLRVLPEIQTPITFPPAPPAPVPVAIEDENDINETTPDIVDNALHPILEAADATGDSNGTDQ